MDTSKYFVSSVDSASRILFYLSRYKTKQATLTEISTSLKINKTTTLRILKTLELHKLVYYDPERRKYSLGIHTAVLGYRVDETLDYLKVIKKFMKEATEKTSLTTAIVQRTTKNRAMFVNQVETEVYPKLTISVGNKFPLLEVSFGKWFLSYMEKHERDQLLKDGLPKKTSKTIVDKETYKAELRKMKDINVTVSREEYTEGVIAISSPIFDQRKEVIAVFTVIGISNNISYEKEKEIVDIVEAITNKCNIEMENYVVKDLII